MARADPEAVNNDGKTAIDLFLGREDAAACMRLLKTVLDGVVNSSSGSSAQAGSGAITSLAQLEPQEQPTQPAQPAAPECPVCLRLGACMTAATLSSGQLALERQAACMAAGCSRSCPSSAATAQSVFSVVPQGLDCNGATSHQRLRLPPTHPPIAASGPRNTLH